MIRFRAVAPLVMALAVVSGCTASAEPSSSEPETPPPFVACDTLASPPASASPAPSPNELPDLSLPCFTGGEQVNLRDVRLPAVINIWGSWCSPCREELPVIQGLADRADGRLTVFTVDSMDRREGATAFAADNGISMPTLFDPEQSLAIAVKQPTLPATIFVDPAGKVYVHRLPLDVDGLIKQVKEHTGVTVTR
ncbi:TlpA disulfide reductase family protein [Actinoplanes sp. NPDC023936]|uniref:TlpA family protein disulfide reductase n=1 Tax=Actinoplanes sp. NPDC023936 TaxID=3154910 RepID=UPI003402CDEB